MYLDALAALACPACHSQLTLDIQRQAADGSISEGTLTCTDCRQRYAIRDGIAELLLRPAPYSAAQLVNRLPLAAWAYERTWRPHALSLLSGQPFPAEQELALVCQQAGVTRGGLYIDVACGNGFYARALAEQLLRSGHSGHVIALDHSLPMVREAARRARSAGLPISFLQASAQQLPLQAAQAAALVIGGSWNEIGDQAAAAGELRRVVRDDGRIVMMYLQGHQKVVQRGFQKLMSSGGITFPTDAAIEQLMRTAGFAPISGDTLGIVAFRTFATQASIDEA